MAERLIKYIQKTFKTDARFIAKGSFWLAIGYAIQIFSSLALTIAFANLLDKQSYGIYQYIIAGGAILGAFTLSGLAIAVKRSVAQGNESALRYGFKTKLLWSTTVVLLSGAVAGYYFFNGNSVLGTGFLIIGAFAPFIESFGLYKSYLSGTGRLKEYALLGFWRKPVVVVAVLIGLLLTDNPIILLAVYFMANLLSVASIYFLVVKKYNLPTQKKNHEVLSYSKHLSVLGVINVVGNNADKVVLFTMLGAVEVAVYSFAMLPLTHSLKFFGYLSNDLVLPKFANRTYKIIRSSILNKIVLFFLVTAIIVTIYFFAAEPIYSLLFPAYPEAILLSQIAMLALLTKPATLFQTMFYAHRHEKSQYFIFSSTTIVRLVSLFLLVPLYNVMGAILAVLITNIYWAIAASILFYSLRK